MLNKSMLGIVCLKPVSGKSPVAPCGSFLMSAEETSCFQQDKVSAQEWAVAQAGTALSIHARFRS